MLEKFIVGEQYTNDQVSVSLQVENLGGIRPSVDEKKRLKHIAIMTKIGGKEKNILENPYQDRIEQGILVFTGQGRSGNQSLTGRNKRIVEQLEMPVPLFCFESCGRQSYVFLGLLELLRYYYEIQIDSSKNLRRVLIFEFKIHSEISIIPINMAKFLTIDFLPKDRQDLPISESDQEVEVPEINQLQNSGSELLEVETIRSQLFSINPYKFEYLLKDLIEKTGFRSVHVTPPSQDGGIDINAYVEEKNVFFANTLVQFQAKRWRHSIGSIEINNFRGALSFAAKGVFVTTSYFTKNAIQEAKNSSKPSIALIDGFSLANLLLENHIKVTLE